MKRDKEWVESRLQPDDGFVPVAAEFRQQLLEGRAVPEDYPIWYARMRARGWLREDGTWPARQSGLSTEEERLILEDPLAGYRLVLTNETSRNLTRSAWVPDIERAVPGVRQGYRISNGGASWLEHHGFGMIQWSHDKADDVYGALLPDELVMRLDGSRMPFDGRRSGRLRRGMHASYSWPRKRPSSDPRHGWRWHPPVDKDSRSYLRLDGGPWPVAWGRIEVDYKEDIRFVLDPAEGPEAIWTAADEPSDMAADMAKDAAFREDLRKDDGLARELYSSMCNVVWRHQGMPEGTEWSVSWRSAGRIVAELRGLGEEYTDFYCSSGEGDVTERIAARLSAMGWTPEETG